jgi:hypothetical protein
MWRHHFIPGLLNVLGFTPREENCLKKPQEEKGALQHFTISFSHIKLILIIQHNEFLGLTGPAAKTKPVPAGAPVPAFYGWLRCRACIAALSYPEMLARPSLYSPRHPILLQ